MRQGQAEGCRETCECPAASCAAAAPASEKRWWARHRPLGAALNASAGTRARIDHESGVAVPSGLAGRCEVIESRLAGPRQRAAQRVHGHIGQQLGASRCADLVVDHGRAVHARRPAEASSGRNCRRARHTPNWCERSDAGCRWRDSLLAFELGAAIDIQRPGRHRLRSTAFSPLPSKT